MNIMDSTALMEWFCSHSVSSKPHNRKPCWKLYAHELKALVTGKVLVSADSAELAAAQALEHELIVALHRTLADYATPKDALHALISWHVDVERNQKVGNGTTKLSGSLFTEEKHNG